MSISEHGLLTALKNLLSLPSTVGRGVLTSGFYISHASKARVGGFLSFNPTSSLGPNSSQDLSSLTCLELEITFDRGSIVVDSLLGR